MKLPPDILPNCMRCGLPLVEGEPAIPVWEWGPDSKVLGGIHLKLLCGMDRS